MSASVSVGRPAPPRLFEVDALRGIAALAVVLFHLTTRFAELYPSASVNSLSFRHGHYGVNLFFIISGFVIFMTLERTARPFDFVVSRFSRLFPTYWVAITLTFSISHLLGLPGKLVDLSSALANFAMLHGLLRVPHVDGVYWTLEVELLFYFGMFALYRVGRLSQISRWLLALLALRLLYTLMERQFHIDLPWTLSRLLILQYIPWFALGIAIYASLHPVQGMASWQPRVVALVSVLTLALVETAFVALLSVVLATLVYLAAAGRAKVFGYRLLGHRVLVFLGGISYPLYLLHENISWSLQLTAMAHGASADLAALLALAVAIALASMVRHWVELPAMAWIRARYRARLAYKPAV